MKREKERERERERERETNGMKKSIVRGGFGGNRTENTGRSSSRHYFALTLSLFPISERKQICIIRRKDNQHLSILQLTKEYIRFL